MFKMTVSKTVNASEIWVLHGRIKKTSKIRKILEGGRKSIKPVNHWPRRYSGGNKHACYHDNDYFVPRHPEDYP